jgi:hypothetical protein
VLLFRKRSLTLPVGLNDRMSVFIKGRYNYGLKNVLAEVGDDEALLARDAHAFAGIRFSF